MIHTCGYNHYAWSLKFSLRATIDHHGPSIHPGHYTAFINCWKKHSIATTTKLRNLKLLIAKSPLLHMLNFINWLTFLSFGLEHEGGSLITPMALAHPRQPINSSAETSGLDVFPPCDLCSRPETLVLIHIYIYTYIRMHSLYEFWL